MLVMLAVAWPVTSVCDVWPSWCDRDERDLGSGGSSNFYFPSTAMPGSPTATESQWWKYSRAGAQSAESDQGRVWAR